MQGSAHFVAAATSAAAAAAAPAAAAEGAAARAEALRYKLNFLSCLILAAQNGFGQDVEPFLALCREIWGEEQLWDAVKDLPHGRARQEGPAAEDAEEPFGFELGPFSAGRTHMMYAAQAGDAARMRWLIARGAKLELMDWRGRTALYWASQEGRMEAVRELLARGAAADTAKNDGAMPTLIVSWVGHLEVAWELLARGVAVDAASNDGFTPLHVASFQGHFEVVRALLARGAAADAASNGGLTPLITASQEGHLEVVRALRGAAVDAANNGGGVTPLYIAREKGHLEVVRELLARGAAVDTADIYSGTPVLAASVWGHFEVLQSVCAGLWATKTFFAIVHPAPP
jgi:ankyrin repeat protein